MKSPNAQTPNDNQATAMNEPQGVTLISNINSSDSVENLGSNSRKRDVNLIELIPYNTLPFVQRKADRRTPSLPNII